MNDKIEKVEESLSPLGFETWKSATAQERQAFSQWVSDLCYDSEEIRKAWPTFIAGAIMGRTVEFEAGMMRESEAYERGYNRGLKIGKATK